MSNMQVEVNNKDNGWSDFKIKDTYEHVREYCKKQGLPLNIGLDIGCRGFTIQNILRDHFNPQMIYGFEASPHSFADCNKRYGNDPRIKLFEVAVSNEDGNADFYMNSDKPSGDSLRRNKDKQVRQVKKIRLDRWSEQHNVSSFDVVKIDIEGHELEALEGMGTKLRTVNILVAEARFNDRPTLYHKMASYLESYGLNLYTLVGVYFNQKRISWGDVIFARG